MASAHLVEVLKGLPLAVFHRPVLPANRDEKQHRVLTVIRLLHAAAPLTPGRVQFSCPVVGGQRRGVRQSRDTARQIEQRAGRYEPASQMVNPRNRGSEPRSSDLVQMDQRRNPFWGLSGRPDWSIG